MLYRPLITRAQRDLVCTSPDWQTPSGCNTADLARDCNALEYENLELQKQIWWLEFLLESRPSPRPDNFVSKRDADAPI